MFAYIFIFYRLTGQHKPANSYEKITINKNSRATLNSLRHIIRKNNYRKDLRMVSLIYDWRQQSAKCYSGLHVAYVFVCNFVFHSFQ